MKRQRDILLLLISGFILTVIWIISSVYHNHVTSTISDALQIETIPIDPKFDTETLERIKNRTNVDPRFDIQNTASTSAPSPVPTKVTPSKTITPTLSASPSAR